ncbi:sulfotransferase 1 family member D1-like isoform X2 [Lethenteron reissneri]|uniref:sulfotransferase 1 family member D1-like isoform X2 n=1 Tax=Lethenteron reissneri TaxID=7753 RepID=UPI002AB717A8|nr:sulfotransferase 1 family member D1-like isoform X2 [Lethenteron reissneri]
MERPKLLPVHGVPMLDFIARDWSLVESFKARPGDVLIATYPKAGTTWTQEIVDLIQSGVDVEHCKRGPVYERIVFMEWTGINFVMHRKGVEVLNDMPSPRTIKTHLPYQLMPSSFWDNDCKVIYIARNAKDNAVSAFHFNRMNKLHPEPGTWEEYLHRFMTGNVCWGSWHDHVTDWWNMRERHRILYLFFEDMKEGHRPMLNSSQGCATHERAWDGTRVTRLHGGRSQQGGGNPHSQWGIPLAVPAVAT